MHTSSSNSTPVRTIFLFRGTWIVLNESLIIFKVLSTVFEPPLFTLVFQITVDIIFKTSDIASLEFVPISNTSLYPTVTVYVHIEFYPKSNRYGVYQQTYTHAIIQIVRWCIRETNLFSTEERGEWTGAQLSSSTESLNAPGGFFTLPLSYARSYKQHKRTRWTDICTLYDTTTTRLYLTAPSRILW